jgi:hypothetical protein
MKLSSLAGILWAAGFVGHCVLFAILCFRRRIRTFPVFSVYIGLAALRSPVLFWFWRDAHWKAYTIAYWIFIFCDTCLQLGLLWEIASKVFRRRGAWVPDVGGKLAGWSIASVAMAVALTALQKTAGHNWLENAFLRGSLFPSILICELFVVMVILSSRAGLNWKSHAAGIALGLAVFNFPSVVIDTIANLRGFDAKGYLPSVLESARKELYLACLIYWCYSMWRPELESRRMSPHMEGQVSALRDALLHRDKPWSDE